MRGNVLDEGLLKYVFFLVVIVFIKRFGPSIKPSLVTVYNHNKK